jgi:hypothetical protein
LLITIRELEIENRQTAEKLNAYAAGTTAIPAKGRYGIAL